MSPASKPERPEKEAKTQTECSPSAKGSLVSYLETSPAKRVNSVSNERMRPGPVRRNLTLETGRLLSRDENGGVLHRQPQSSEASRAAQRMKNESLSDIGSDAVEGVRKNSSATRLNSNLKELAIDFLSFYCR